jgi:hypothetical protein
MTQLKTEFLPEHRQFDFWLGDWAVFDYSGYDYSSGTKGNPIGENTITLLCNDYVIHEHAEMVNGMVGYAHLIYNKNDNKWHQMWVDNGGNVAWFSGGLEAGQMILSGERPGSKPGLTAIDRVAWSVMDNNPDRVRQLWQISEDGGKSWFVAADNLYTRKS